MTEKLYLRCLIGCDAAILEFEPGTLSYKKMSLNFYENAEYATAGICGFLVDKKSKESLFVALYEKDDRMFLTFGENEYDLFDQRYSLALKRRILSNTATLNFDSELLFSFTYRKVAGIDDIFGYVEDILAHKPRRIVRRREVHKKSKGIG